MGKCIGLAVAGVALILVGIPMLLLPGPGLLAIAGGVACLVAARKAGRR